jgi:hypothetical protein
MTERTIREALRRACFLNVVFFYSNSNWQDNVSLYFYYCSKVKLHKPAKGHKVVPFTRLATNLVVSFSTPSWKKSDSCTQPGNRRILTNLQTTATDALYLVSSNNYLVSLFCRVPCPNHQHFSNNSALDA